MTLWALLLFGVVAAVDTPAVRIAFLDVGQADATVIFVPGGRAALVDGGRSAAPVLAALDALGVDTVDLVVATHADADHIGGLDGVLVARPVRSYLDNGARHNTAEYRELMDVVTWSGVARLEPTARTIPLGEASLRVLPPWPDAQDQNNASVGLLLEYGAFRVLLTGDAEREALGHFLRLGIPPVAVLKASHHGALDGISPGWVQATQPRAVVISVGAGNPYGHPDPMALRYFGLYAEEVFRTDRDGTVLVTGRRDGSFDVTTRDASGTPVVRRFPAR
jgi:competence protein ComEC